MYLDPVETIVIRLMTNPCNWRIDLGVSTLALVNAVALPLSQLREVTMLKATLTLAAVSLALLLSTSVSAEN